MNNSQNKINKNIEHIKALRETLPEKEYRRLVGIVAADSFVNEKSQTNESFTRRDIQKFAGRIMENEGLEKYSYQFFRTW